MNHWELFYLKLIRKEEQGFFPNTLRFLLWIMSFPYRFYMILRNFAYDQGWLSRYTPPVPVVISIGNLVAGGVGKTPVTLMIADAFYAEYTLGILSRGYRSEAEKLPNSIVVSRGAGPILHASFSGDEAYMISENLPKAIVVVGRNRRESSCIAAKMGAKLILLDDAMQHRRIQRDKEVVVMDLNDPWGLGQYLPRGLLREGQAGLKRADLIVLNHVHDSAAYDKIKNEIAKYSTASVIGTKMEVSGVFDLSGSPMSIEGKNIAIFCGIAHPDYFVNTVKNLGAEISDEFFLGDHKTFSVETLTHFSQRAKVKGAEFLVCTEKDKVKFSSLPENILPLLWVKIRLDIVHNKEAFETFVHEGKELLRLHG